MRLFAKEAMPHLRRAPVSPMRRRFALLLILTTGLTACSSVIESQRRHEAEIKAADVALDRDRIEILSGDLTLPHTQLGPLEYSEPFSADANDEKHIDDQLRMLAIARWGNQVAAIIGVESVLSPDATQLRVSAIAVRVNGDCSFCRHQGGYPQGR
jgi:hypothetical protein